LEAAAFQLCAYISQAEKLCAFYKPGGLNGSVEKVTVNEMIGCLFSNSGRAVLANTPLRGGLLQSRDV
jgi:hypothetical protein